MMVPVYCAVSMAVVTGVAFRTGATTLGMASRVIDASDAGVTGAGQAINNTANVMQKNPKIALFILPPIKSQPGG